jgi:hypothetical protein
MIEEMYQQETKELEGSSAGGGAGGPDQSGNDPSGADDMHSPTTTGAMQHSHSQPQGVVMQHGGGRYGIQQEHGMPGIHPHKLDPGAAGPSAADAAFVGLDPVELLGGDAHVGASDDLYGRFEPGVRMRYGPSATGAATGDVSLTLGLQHAGAGAGNQGPDASGRFSLRDYNGC